LREGREWWSDRRWSGEEAPPPEPRTADGKGRKKKKWRERDLAAAADPAAAAARDEEGERGRGEITAEKLTGFEKRGCWRRRRGSSLGERGSTAHQVRRRCEDWLSRVIGGRRR
jgi:hypothetical protein